MEEEEKKNVVKYLLDSYETAQGGGRNAAQYGIGYNGKNFTFSIEINEKQYLLTKYQLMDFPGVGDELAQKIQLWVK